MDNTHKDIKDNIESFETYFSSNKLAYKAERKFVNESTLTDDDIAVLSDQDKPALTFNVLSPKINRLIGEFGEQTPGLVVKGTGQADMAAQETIVDGHLRAIFSCSDYKEVGAGVFAEQLEGGFSVLTVTTEYKKSTGFDQEIILGKVDDPTMCGFDPMARKAHKGDGKYCYRVYPKQLDDFKAQWPKANTSQMNFFSTQSDAFQWCYMVDRIKVVLVCEYYEKVTKYETYVQCENPLDPNFPLSLPKKEYNEVVKNWHDVTVPPRIIATRRCPITKIVRYVLTGTEILEGPEETDYQYLPYVFVAGKYYYDGARQVLSSYFREAKDAQRMMNLAGSELVNSVEHLRQTDILMPHAALPRGDTEFRKVYKNPHQAVGSLIWEHLDENGQPVPPPTVQSRGEISQAVMSIFTGAPELIQHILGSYDAQQGVQSGELSGEAIVQGAMQSNGAAKCFVDNYLIALNQCGKIIVDLLPKYYKTATTIPLLSPDNQHTYLLINDGRKETSLDYSSDDLGVTVKPGASFAIQKQQALKTMIQMMSVSEAFKTMMEKKGLPILVDNIEIKGQDRLMAMAEDFLKEMEQAAQEAAKNPQPDPNMVLANAELMKAQVAAKKLEVDQAIEQKRLEQKQLEIMQQSAKDKANLLINYQKMEDAHTHKEADLALKQQDQNIKLAKELLQQPTEPIKVDIS